MSDFPALRANAYRDTWCGQVLADRVDAQVARRRLGPSPPRPRRARVRRPARPDGPGAARLQPRRGGRRVRARPQAPRRGRDLGGGPGRPPLAGDGQPGDADRRVRAAGGRGGDAGRRRDARRSRSRASPARSARSCVCATATSTCAASRCRRAIATRASVTRGDPRVLRRRGVPRDRDADALALDPGGRPRLPRAGAPRAGHVLRAAAVAAALQAAPDGRRVRALLPDRPLLPRRGPARRPPARLHPARRRALVRRGRGRDRRQRADDGPRLRAGGRAGGALPIPRLPYDEAIGRLRHRPARPALRAGAGRPLRRARRHRVQGVPRRDRGRGRGEGPERRRPRPAAIRARRPDRAGAGARREGARLGVPRGRGLALADREVPLRRGAGAR